MCFQRTDISKLSLLHRFSAALNLEKGLLEKDRPHPICTEVCGNVYSHLQIFSAGGKTLTCVEFLQVI